MGKIKKYSQFILKEELDINGLLTDDEVINYFQPIIDFSISYEIEKLINRAGIIYGNYIVFFFNLDEKIGLEELEHIAYNIKLDHNLRFYFWRTSINRSIDDQYSSRIDVYITKEELKSIKNAEEII